MVNKDEYIYSDAPSSTTATEIFEHQSVMELCTFVDLRCYSP